MMKDRNDKWVNQKMNRIKQNGIPELIPRDSIFYE